MIFSSCFGLAISPDQLLRSSLVELRIVGFPDEVADLDDVEIEFAVFEGETDRAVAQRQDFIDAPALLVVGIAAAIDDEAVAGLERRLGFDLDVAATDGGDRRR